ncbi:MAG: hypothetical protein QM773_13365 [Hyphomonadaceae bacterium]
MNTQIHLSITRASGVAGELRVSDVISVMKIPSSMREFIIDSLLVEREWLAAAAAAAVGFYLELPPWARPRGSTGGGFAACSP